MENLVYKLESEIQDYIVNNSWEVKLIIMHPKTWQNLKEEIFIGVFDLINRHSTDLKYRGIRVIRSYDIEEGVFELKHK